jgi:hypothetical protein
MISATTRGYSCKPVIVLLLAMVRLSWAAPPDATAIFKAMKAALEPEKPSVRKMVFSMHSAESNETAQITVRQARKRLADGMRSVSVVMEPDSLKGIVVLVTEQKDKPNAQYVYLPTLRRVRRLGPVAALEPFLNTDFTYSDVGVLDVHERTLKLKASKKSGATTIYELEEIPRNRWYYSRIVDSIAADSMLPVERDFYDVANVLWRKETFPDTPLIDGIPTPVRIHMEDKESGDWSEIQVIDVQYDADVPDEVFDPARLRETANHPLWAKPGK